VQWECGHADRHRWWASPNQVCRPGGTWCPSCGARDRVVERKAAVYAAVQAIAKAKNGECLSTEYVSATTPMRFRCNNHGEFTSTANRVKNMGTWCPSCSRGRRHRRLITLAELQRWAAAQGGTCLARHYERDHDGLQWRCRHGHRIVASYDHLRQRVRRGANWCPNCHTAQLAVKIATGRAAAAARRAKRLAAARAALED